MELDKTLPKKDFIVVRRKLGAGGDFLRLWLTQAKLNENNTIALTEAGQADFVLNDFFDLEYKNTAPKPGDSHKVYLSHLGRYTKKEGSIAPWIAQDANHTLEECLEYMERAITLTYTLADVDNLVKLYINKQLKADTEYQGLTATEIESIKNVNARHLRDAQPAWGPDLPETDKNINMSFQDWLSGDIDAIVNKLSAFTGIPTANFVKDDLANWRTMTQATLAKPI
jgi:hypothetical protein